MKISQPVRATTKQFVLVLAVLALLLPLAGWLVVRLQGPQEERDAYANLATIARLKTDQVENWLSAHQKNAQMLSGDTDFARRDREDVALLVAKASHQQWIKGVVDCMSNPERIGHFLHKRQCRFGRWFLG